MKQVLVTGGAGYIGSHTVQQLIQAGFKVVVVDNLSNGFKEALPLDTVFYKIDVRRKIELKSVFEKHNISAVIHLAGLAEIAESFKNESEYLDNNVNASITLLELCHEFNIKNFIFSSSSTLYGNANIQKKLTEQHNISVMSPYGKSKLICEEAIAAAAKASDLNYIIFRYFNVAGASSDLTNGPRGMGSGRLIFNITKAAVKGKVFVVNGRDYPTKDGTCVRDYIHVEDIADIHVLGLKSLQTQVVRQKILNCGYGEGYTVLQIIENFKAQNNIDFNVEFGPRRAGDPTYLVGDNRELVKVLNWKSRFSAPLAAICNSAYLWEKQQN